MREIPMLFNEVMIRELLATKRKRKLYPRPGEGQTSPEHLARRLANGMTIDTSTGCWMWVRAKNLTGYGTITVAGRTEATHRLAYTLGVGPIPAGMDVMHRCDRPSCINPGHLVPGTRSDNMRDCHRKGRSRIPNPRMAGESNGAAKLTTLDVQAIRNRLKSGHSQALIASAFGISQATVSLISQGKAWKEVVP